MITREEYLACVAFLANPTDFRHCNSTIYDMAISRFRWEIDKDDLIRMCTEKVHEYTKNLEDHLADVKCRLRRIEEHLGLES